MELELQVLTWKYIQIPRKPLGRKRRVLKRKPQHNRLTRKCANWVRLSIMSSRLLRLTFLWWSPSAPWWIFGHASCYGTAHRSHCFFPPAIETHRSVTMKESEAPSTFDKNHNNSSVTDRTVKALSTSSVLIVCIASSCIFSSVWSIMPVLDMFEASAKASKAAADRSEARDRLCCSNHATELRCPVSPML